MNKPTGNVTFLLTDIESSTKLAQEFPKTLLSALDKHHSILQTAIESNNGFVFKIIGDSFYCAFENANDAVNAAVEAQLNLGSQKWNDAEIKVRMGIHSGDAEWDGKEYAGYITLARTTRVMSVAYGGQILISEYAHDLVTGKVMNKISFRDLGERRLKDLKEPVRLYQIISNELVSDFPPLKTLDVRPNNLPIQLTSFIGREKEMKEVLTLLESSRLLTLLGPGGTGKTRLSIQAGAEMIDQFENGVWITELASITDPSLIYNAIASVLKIREEGGRKLADVILIF